MAKLHIRILHTGVLIAMLFSAVAWSQQTSTILGSVKDASGAVIPGAKVVATNIGTLLHRDTVTDTVGEYRIPSLPPGNYNLEVSAEGFSSYVLSNVKVDVGQMARLDATLKVGEAAQKITVEGSQPILQTADAQVGNVIENSTIVGLPLNGRNFTQLNLLIPGVTAGSSNNIVQRNGYGARAGGVSFSVNGQRSTNTQFLLDGISFLETEIGSAAFSPSIDAIQEFKVQTSGFSAEFGTQAGGQINMISKTGSRNFHGGVYDFFRNDAFDARNFFVQTGAKPELRRNQFGGTLGGPLFTEKLLFFGSYEGTRLITGITQTGLVPTATQALGDFSSLPITLKNPFTGGTYANNKIPTINPVIAKMLTSYVPAPNAAISSSLNYQSNDPLRVIVDQYLGRIDYNMGTKDTAWVRYIYEKTDNIQPKFFPTDGLTEKLRAFGEASGWTHIFRPNLLNEFRVGVTHFAEDLHLANAGKTDVVSQLGQTGLCEDPSCWGVPTMMVTGFAAFGEHGYSGPNAGGLGGTFKSGPVAFHDTLVQTNDTFYWTKGVHSLRFGAEYDIRRFAYNEALYPRGVYTFDGSFTSPTGAANPSTAFADFLLGLPKTSLNSITIFNPDFRAQEIHPWFQDDWRVTPNLTLNLGIRYELMPRPISANNRVANLDYSTPLPTTVLASNAGSHGFSRALVDNDYNDVAPRIGFAYLLPWMKSMVVRGGYGIFYQREADNTYIDMAINAPFVVQNNFTLTAAQVNSYSFSNPFGLTTTQSSTYYTMQKDWRDGYSQQWNAAVQTQVPGGVSLQAAYVGNKVTHLSKNIPLNQSTPGATAPATRSPYPSYGSISYFTSEGASTYNSLQLQAERRISSTLTFLAAYTYARCIDDASAGSIGETDTGVQDIHNLRAQKGLCAQDTRNRATVSSVYKLPFGRHLRYANHMNWIAEELVGGWELSGVLTSSTGQPFTPIMSGDYANIGYGTTYPDRIGDPNSGPHNFLHEFNTAAFAAPALGPGHIGTSRRNVAIGPGTNTLDIATMKNFALREELRLQFRAEMFNLLNHPNFTLPGATFGTAAFGQSSAAQDPRIFQFSLKVIF